MQRHVFAAVILLMYSVSTIEIWVRWNVVMYIDNLIIGDDDMDQKRVEAIANEKTLRGRTFAASM